MLIISVFVSRNTLRRPAVLALGPAKRIGRSQVPAERPHRLAVSLLARRRAGDLGIFAQPAGHQTLIAELPVTIQLSVLAMIMARAQSASPPASSRRPQNSAVDVAANLVALHRASRSRISGSASCFDPRLSRCIGWLPGLSFTLPLFADQCGRWN
jgi:hypothetical protein